MAYGNYIASVNWKDVVQLREESQQTLHPQNIIFVSQLVAYYVTEEPLKACLAKILDGGQELSPSFWHPFRVPIFHSPDEVHKLESSLRKEWNALSHEVKDSHSFQRDISEILVLLKFATDTNSAVISVLEPPADEERANKVLCPFDNPDELPIAWGELNRIWGHLS